MLRPEMNLPERSEFSSQALLLIRFQTLYFSQIPEWNKDPTSRISVPFYPGNSEYFPVFPVFWNLELSGILLTGCTQKTAGYRRWDAPSGNEGCVLLVTLKQILEKQKTWRQALKFTAELSERMRVFCCKFCS